MTIGRPMAIIEEQAAKGGHHAGGAGTAGRHDWVGTLVRHGRLVIREEGLPVLQPEGCVVRGAWVVDWRCRCGNQLGASHVTIDDLFFDQVRWRRIAA